MVNSRKSDEKSARDMGTLTQTFPSNMLFAPFYFYSYAFNDDQVEMILATVIKTKKFILTHGIPDEGRYTKYLSNNNRYIALFNYH